MQLKEHFKLVDYEDLAEASLAYLMRLCLLELQVTLIEIVV